MPTKTHLPVFLFFVLFCCSTSVFAQAKPKAYTQTPLSKEPEKCLNIAISTVKMEDMCTKTAVFEVTIENKGLRCIDLPNSSTLGLQYFWSGDAQYDPGDVLIGGTFVHNFGDYGKSLSPDGTYTMKVKVPLAKKSRYLNYLVFVIDAAFLYDECDEKDNIKGVVVK
jgi:hypothetical protein